MSAGSCTHIDGWGNACLNGCRRGGSTGPRRPSCMQPPCAPSLRPWSTHLASRQAPYVASEARREPVPQRHADGPVGLDGGVGLNKLGEAVVFVHLRCGRQAGKCEVHTPQSTLRQRRGPEQTRRGHCACAPTWEGSRGVHVYGSNCEKPHRCRASEIKTLGEGLSTLHIPHSLRPLTYLHRPATPRPPPGRRQP